VAEKEFRVSAANWHEARIPRIIQSIDRPIMREDPYLTIHLAIERVGIQVVDAATRGHANVGDKYVGFYRGAIQEFSRKLALMSRNWLLDQPEEGVFAKPGHSPAMKVTPTPGPQYRERYVHLDRLIEA
jgi:hypothetical protein